MYILAQNNGRYHISGQNVPQNTNILIINDIAKNDSIEVIKFGLTKKGQPWIVYRSEGKIRSQFLKKSDYILCCQLVPTEEHKVWIHWKVFATKNADQMKKNNKNYATNIYISQEDKVSISCNCKSHYFAPIDKKQCRHTDMVAALSSNLVNKILKTQAGEEIKPDPVLVAKEIWESNLAPIKVSVGQAEYIAKRISALQHDDLKNFDLGGLQIIETPAGVFLGKKIVQPPVRRQPTSSQQVATRQPVSVPASAPVPEKIAAAHRSIRAAIKQKSQPQPQLQQVDWRRDLRTGWWVSSLGENATGDDHLHGFIRRQLASGLEVFVHVEDRCYQQRIDNGQIRNELIEF
jgi:hypothetical protein